MNKKRTPFEATHPAVDMEQSHASPLKPGLHLQTLRLLFSSHTHWPRTAPVNIITN